MPAPPALVALDWGSSSMRAALLGADGSVLQERQAASGLLTLPAGDWAQVFHGQVGDWLRQWPGLPCLMSGMVGSRQGWVEAPYCPCPASPADVAAQLRWLGPQQWGAGGDGSTGHVDAAGGAGRAAALAAVAAAAAAIVPGLSTERAAQPDVMRGEETQVFGALRLLGWQGREAATLLLPGTHSKWVRVQHGQVADFSTHMTGECYALFRRHSILARGLPALPAEGTAVVDEAFDAKAFDDGVAMAQQPGGLLQHLFGVRTLGLFDRLSAAALASRLSGLVIGEELRAQRAFAPATLADEVVLVGAPALASRYARALAQLGVATRSLGAQASWAGLMDLAAAAGMLAAAPRTISR